MSDRHSRNGVNESEGPKGEEHGLEESAPLVAALKFLRCDFQPANLLAQAIGERKSAKPAFRSIRWISKDMGARVDVADTEAVYSAMENEPRPKTGNNRA